MKQLDHFSTQNLKKTFPIRLLCDSIRSPENVGMIFRLSEAMGVEKLFLSGNTVAPTNIRLLRAARSANKYLAFDIVENAIDLITKHKGLGYTICALEITDKSLPLHKTSFIDQEKVLLIVGSERNGVSDSILKLVDFSIVIEMFGENSSMNVANSCAMALFKITSDYLHK